MKGYKWIMMNVSNQRKLRFYVKIAGSLKKTKFFRETKTVGVRNVTRKNGKMRLITFGFNEELLRSALIDFRKIILEGEGSNFYKICNIIETGDLPQGLKNKARVLRKEFSDALNQDATLYDRKTNDKPKEVIDKWLNGKYFHQDRLKRRSIDRMNFIKHVHKIVFVATVLDLSRIAIELADTINLYLNQKP